MSVLAITGNLTSGKSTVAALLKTKGAKLFDSDKVIHNLYSDRNSVIYKKIAKVFPSVLKKERICRKTLGEIVFSDDKKLKQLESIVHPVVVKELKKWVMESKNKKGVFVAEVPLLFEKNLQKNFQGVILVTAKRDMIIKRAMAKFNLSAAGVKKRLSLFIPINRKKKDCEFVINNSLTIADLKREVNSLWNILKESNNQVG